MLIKFMKLLAFFLSVVYNGISVTLGSFTRKFTVFLYCPIFYILQFPWLFHILLTPSLNSAAMEYILYKYVTLMLVSEVPNILMKFIK